MRLSLEYTGKVLKCGSKLPSEKTDVGKLIKFFSKMVYLLVLKKLLEANDFWDFLKLLSHRSWSKLEIDLR